ncbi:hypothetical protein BCR33DRAFT_851070 [Rhizoclosmatium globosum]|uniref:Secreted protein n=1 Tax=Rhizoclosmatium globosum TaxID=329046 RepID=A0A1Y2CAF4_9FUNG|nr:hypothetical protein BCR33DRAFT_851070 [Rhizoclosmatium globosum]|eukprot:ORY43315.1 hypothetical protein BCR33DRAFT_851070 [Rhizoclosmatium globosum]
MKLATTLILVSTANSAMALSWSNFASIFTGGRAAVGSTPSNTTTSTSSSSSQGAQTAAASSSASFVPTLDQATCICSPPNQQSLLKVVSSCISPSDKDTAAVASALQSGCAQLSASLVVSQNSPCNLNGDFACGCINAPSSSSSSSTQQPNNPSPNPQNNPSTSSNSNSNPSKGIDPLTPPTGPCQTFGKFQCSKADNLSLYQCAYTSTTQLSWVWQSKCLPSQYCVDNGPNGYVGCMNKDQGSMGPKPSLCPTNNGPVNNGPSGQFWNNAPSQNNGPISNSCTYGDWKCASDAKTILICSYVAGNSLAWIEQSKCPGQCLVKGGYVGCV